ncbi:hypothetical protein ACIBIZ_03395 [Nonomuraea spiralis]|uniref:hypothetical protein n=1 Tax=Nonomuraea spiralis TaxID=46182 RepID=UPI0037A5B97A
MKRKRTKSQIGTKSSGRSKTAPRKKTKGDPEDETTPVVHLQKRKSAPVLTLGRHQSMEMDSDTAPRPTTITVSKPHTDIWGTVKFQARKHDLPAGGVVHLRPLVDLRGDTGPKKIAGILISRLQRTPSPFGNRMGDHTTSWQGVVDSVRAALYGKTVKEAATALLAMQATAQAQVSDPDGAARDLLMRLETVDATDAAGRIEPLENSARLVAEQCAIALSEKNESKAAQALATAVAQHLNFLNHLPFSTVPAASARGSTGSGEGTYRGALLAYEAKAAKLAADKGTAAPKPRTYEQNDMRTALWKMFAFDAAMRESYVEYALNPQSYGDVAEQYSELQKVNDELDKALTAVATNKGRVEALKDIPGLLGRIDDVQKTAGIYQGMHRAAGALKAKAEDARTRLQQPHTARRAETARKVIASAKNAHILAEAGQVAADLKKIGDGAPEYAVVVLSNLLYKHLRVMAAAYPHAVTAAGLPDPVSGKLGRPAAEMMVKQLEGALRREYMDLFPKRTEPEQYAPLIESITQTLAGLPPITVEPRTTSWASEAADTNLVVDFDPALKESLVINGRAPAPPGVAGMGCHTTAWAIETQHANHLVSDASSGPQAVKALKEAVRKDLQSRVMELAALLPAEQIEGRQLAGLFDEAASVLNAPDASTAAMAYLSFRNLMPFATVNEGDRGGHAEKKDGGLDITFDKTAMKLAADHKRDELTTDPKSLAGKLLAERDLLATELERWEDDDTLATAVETVRARLKEQADFLKRAKRDELAEYAEEAGKKVYDTRLVEHKRVWKEVQTFRKD